MLPLGPGMQKAGCQIQMVLLEGFFDSCWLWAGQSGTQLNFGNINSVKHLHKKALAFDEGYMYACKKFTCSDLLESEG